MKRMIITMSVPDDASADGIAIALDGYFEGADTTAWEWEDFWLDYSEGVVTPAGDSTADDPIQDHAPAGYDESDFARNT